MLTTKQWFASKKKAGNRNGTIFIVLAIMTGWKRWENGKVVEFVTEIHGHYPKRHELGYDDEEAWECGPDDKPTDPWQNSREGLLIDQLYRCSVHLLHGLDLADAAQSTSSEYASRNARFFAPASYPVVSAEMAGNGHEVRQEIQAAFQDHGLEHSRRGGDGHRARQRRNERSDHLTNVAKRARLRPRPFFFLCSTRPS